MIFVRDEKQVKLITDINRWLTLEGNFIADYFQEEKQLEKLPNQYIRQLVNQIDPSFILFGLSSNNQKINNHFLKYIQKQYQTSIKDHKDWNNSVNVIAMRAYKINEGFGSQILNFLQRSKLISEMNRISQQKKQNQKLVDDVWKQKSQQKIQKNNNKSKSGFNFEVVKGPTYTQRYEQNYKADKTAENCRNLDHRPRCFCLNQRQVVNKDQFTFRCTHCFNYFHTVCMKKKSNSEFCCYCYLEKMIPIKKTIKTIYTGLFRKNTKKHIANIVFPEIQPNQKIQIRCLRLKDGAQSSCLFPDVAQISINNHKIKEFEAINKQSCLKYRKDQPFNLFKGDYCPGVQNTFMLYQNLIPVRERQLRYQSQNHLLGIYVIEDLKIESLITDIKSENILGFSQSQQSLFESFKLGDDDITCQLIKIPIVCPLSTMRIQIPARGVFCHHFQCFDLKNYLTLISQTQNPRWKCPLCGNLAYQLEVDSITLEILKQTSTNSNIKQILFFKNGDYTGIVQDEPLPERKNIKNLNIPERKRRLPQPLSEEKPMKKIFYIPENAQVIDLDD